MSRSEHQLIQELLGAYSLNAIDPDEKTLIDDHLRTCETCRAEVAEHREVAAVLNPEAAAPEGMWNRISASLEAAPPPQLRVVAERGVVSRSIMRTAAGLLAAAVFALGFVVIDQNRKIDRLSVSLGEQKVASAAYETLSDPRAKTLALRSEGTSNEAQLVFAPDGRGLVIASELTDLSADETYQLWALVGDAKISSGLLGPQPGISLFTFKGRADGFAITKEPAGGSQQPTGDPVAFGVFA